MAQTCTPGIPCTTYAPDKGANNTKTDSKTCDGDVMNQIHARAFMEAQRENIVNQLSIRKPDSILSYTCYDQYLAVAAKNAPPIFSEAEDKWKDIYPNWDWMRVGMSVQGKPDNYYRIERVLKVKMGDGDIIPLINGIALGPATNSTQKNFSHDFLGGSQKDMVYPLASDMDEALGKTTGNAPRRAMNCLQMQAVWQAAKCQNFAENDPGSTTPKFFYSLEDLVYDPENDPPQTSADKDPRKLGSAACTTVISGVLAGATTGIPKPIMDVYQNKAPEYKKFETGKETPPYPFVLVDGIRHLKKGNIDDYFDPKLQPFDGESACAPPIPTGVQITIRTGNITDSGDYSAFFDTATDYVCPNPECRVESPCTALDGCGGGVLGALSSGHKCVPIDAED